MATVAVQSVATGGLTATYATASGGGDKVAPGDGICLHVKNGGGVSLTVTLVTPQTVDGLAVTDRTVTVGAGAEKFIALPDLYEDPADGLASITWSATTSVTFAALRA